MIEPGELGQTLAAIAAALDGVSARWAIGGSLASAAYGEPRATNDVDIVAQLDERSAVGLLHLLGDRFYGDAETAREAARSCGSFNVIDNESFIKIDVFIPAAGPMGAGQLDRRRELVLFPGMRALPILGPEDTVLQKIRWFRLGGEVSDRQWRDIVAILRLSGPRLDRAYLDSVAHGAGLGSLLARATADAFR